MKLFGNPVKGLGGTALVLGFTSVMGVSSLFGQMYTDTLADLADHGGTLSIGDKTFSGFGYFASSDLTSFDPTQIRVEASIGSDGLYYLTWSGNIALATFGTATADLKLNYIVMASAGVISMIDQAYTGSAQGGGLLAIDETVSTGNFGGPIVGHSHLDAFDVSDPPTEMNDLINLTPPETFLYVTKDISLAVVSPGGSLVTISQVAQSFHQVPEPSTVLLGSLGIGLLLFLKSGRQGRRG
ncbi:MAG: PEP-CTERM sorting domain-containing protein [Verrucomicrobiota bacterium]|jgi:hypothetical protein